MKKSAKTKKNSFLQALSYIALGLIVGVSLNNFPLMKIDGKTFPYNKTKEAPPQKTSPSQSTPPTTSTKILPSAVNPIHRSSYSAGYDARNKNPAWVYERLTPDCLKGAVTREDCQFKEDNRIPSIFRATLADYRNSGYDRGHLAPAADHKSSVKNIEDTFFLSNMCPQDPQFNRGYWAKVEKYVRDLTKSHTVIHVFTGPLYLPKKEADGSKWVKYRVIGPNNVAVPTHFFKILMLEKAPGKITYQAYILPNTFIDSKKPIESFKTTVENVESVSGIIFQKNMTM